MNRLLFSFWKPRMYFFKQQNPLASCEVGFLKLSVLQALGQFVKPQGLIIQRLAGMTPAFLSKFLVWNS